jgi:hypothetical protein
MEGENQQLKNIGHAMEKKAAKVEIKGIRHSK